MITRLVPAPLHRALLPVVHRIRHIWRKVSKAKIEGVSVILTNADGDILFLRHSYGPKVWALPGGGLDRDEAPSDAAKREIYEELGCRLNAVTSVGTIAETISGSPHIAHVFTALIDEEPVPDRREILEAQFFARGALPKPMGRLTYKRLKLWQEHLEQR